MKNYFLLLLGVTAVALGNAAPAQAEDPAINFDLSPDASRDQAAIAPDALVKNGQFGTLDWEQSNHVEQSLRVPAYASEAPVQSGDGIEELPPPPTVASAPIPPPFPEWGEPQPMPQPEPVAPPSPETEPSMPVTDSDGASSEPLALSFELPPTHLNSSLAQEYADSLEPMAQPGIAPVPDDILPGLEELFQRGTDSLVATAVGSAEGTRTPEGDRTPAYYGHSDPGNGVWNLGTFSYQHGANSPEEADLKQLRRLQEQFMQLQQEAGMKGVQLSLEEKLNGIDLANQSPRAALSRGGYIDRLKEAREAGLTGTEAILWARVRSYLDPDTQQWNAPGLGNTVEGISRDQERRMNQVERAIAAYGDRYGLPSFPPQPESTDADSRPEQDGGIASLFLQPMQALFSSPAPADAVPASSAEMDESVIDQLLGFDLSTVF